MFGKAAVPKKRTCGAVRAASPSQPVRTFTKFHSIMAIRPTGWAFQGHAEDASDSELKRAAAGGDRLASALGVASVHG